MANQPPPSHRGAGRLMSQSDAIPIDDIKEITDRIEILSHEPKVEAHEMSREDLGTLLSSFESQLLELNKSLSKETRTTRETLKNFSTEFSKAKESAADLASELKSVVRRAATR